MLMVIRTAWREEGNFVALREVDVVIIVGILRENIGISRHSSLEGFLDSIRDNRSTCNMLDPSLRLPTLSQTDSSIGVEVVRLNY